MNIVNLFDNNEKQTKRGVLTIVRSFDMDVRSNKVWNETPPAHNLNVKFICNICIQPDIDKTKNSNQKQTACLRKGEHKVDKPGNGRK